MAYGSQHIYGNTTVGGNGTVQLGDRQVTNHFTIGQAYFSLTGEFYDTSGGSHTSGIGTQSRPPGDQAAQGKERAHTENGRIKKRGRPRKEKCSERARQCQDSSSGSSMDQFLLRVLSTVLPVSGHQSSSSASSPPRSPPTSYEPLSPNWNCRSSPFENRDRPEHEIEMLLSCLSSYIRRKNISVDDPKSFLRACQHDPYLTTLISAICTGLCKPSTAQLLKAAPSPKTLTLEDAYGRTRPISMDICVDFQLLKRFLEVHYENIGGKAGHALVKAGQFHVMLGSRRGKAIGRDEWQHHDFQPDWRLVNSVYVSKEEAKCPGCQVDMAVTAQGEFHW